LPTPHEGIGAHHEGKITIREWWTHHVAVSGLAIAGYSVPWRKKVRVVRRRVVSAADATTTLSENCEVL